MPNPDPHPPSYDPASVARRYDEAGEREWERFERRLCDRVALEVHRRVLGEFVRPGDRVLDAGAGPGRFTIELARVGATVVVGDISPVQLSLNAGKLAEAGLEEHIEARELLDITDLSSLADESFDAVVCFGGPLSYVRDRADDAVQEFVRVTKPGGYLLVSVMSKFGATRIWLEDILGRVADEYGIDAVDDVVQTGDLTGELNDGHALTMYTSRELESLLDRANCDVVDIASANFLTARRNDLDLDDARQHALFEWDVEACRNPGTTDGGTHIIAAAQRRPTEKHRSRNRRRSDSERESDTA